MAKYKIQKTVLQPHFLGLNVDSVGSALGQLKYCGTKLYLYLMCNSDGFTWNINPVALANWLGVDYNDDSQARKVRKIIREGTEDLQQHGFLKSVGKDSYIISEQIVPEWLNDELGTNCSGKAIQSQEQFVPENKGSVLGTNCSSEDAEKEKIVPDCYGF